MTEHGASIFVFFFLGEYSSLILMSAFMAIFFLGGHHFPDLHKLLLDPFLFMYNYYWSSDLSSYFQLFSNLSNQVISIDLYSDDQAIYTEFWKWNSESLTLFSSKDTIFNSFSLLIDKIYGSYILGFKIIIVVFFFIWVRASFPRLRYDQLMLLCWKELLPLIFAYILFTICLFYAFDMMPYGISF
jgi:NADH-ubiquinone oxidoreductase chain 1